MESFPWSRILIRCLDYEEPAKEARALVLLGEEERKKERGEKEEDRLEMVMAYKGDKFPT